MEAGISSNTYRICVVVTYKSPTLPIILIVIIYFKA